MLERPRLLQQLHTALQHGHVLVHAPAGYGKTTLLHHLLRQRPGSASVVCTVADMDLAHLRPRLEPHLRPGVTLLVDDVHLLAEGRESLAWLRGLLDRDDLRLVFCGQRRMEWDLTPLQAESVVTVLSESDLRFTLAEGHALLSQERTRQSPETLEAWWQRLHGWPLGLQLLAQHADSPDPLPAAESQLFDYLMERMFSKLPPHLQQFLQVTAFPLWFNDDLAMNLLNNADAPRLRQEVQRRNLFLEPATEDGWFRYHDLVRRFLLRQRPNQQALFGRIVRWFEERDDLEMAIEHALAGGLEEEAARLILALPGTFLNADRRMLTYRRWVNGLDPAVVDRHPRLLVNLGNFLHYVPGMQAEAQELLQRAIQLTDPNSSHGDAWIDEHLWARIYQQHITVREGKYQGAPEELQAVLAHPACTIPQRRFCLELLAMVYADQARYQEARQASAALVALRGQIPEEHLVQHRQNMAITVHALLGDFAEATAATQVAIDFYADTPAWQAHSLLNLCEIHNMRGDWPALARTLERVEGLAEQIEVFGGHNNLWLWLYRTQLAIGENRLDEARAALEQLQSYATYDWAETVAAISEVWLLRRQKDYSAALATAQKHLSNPADMSQVNAVLALEHDIALALAWMRDGVADFELSPQTKRLVRWRCRADLVRLRALLAVVCWRQGDKRWRRHVRAALYARKTYWGYEHLLTQRDPDLGAHFWPLALLSGLADDQARSALGALGQPHPLYPLLEHSDAYVRTRAAEGLAAVGREEALPALGESRKKEKDKGVKAALSAAIANLEERPPPPLRVQLLGGFRLWRGDAEIPAHIWSRPVVLRLFLYFCLHQDKTLTRERVLDDLWPDSDPEKAWVTLRNVYSRLRPVLEPFVQSKGLNRYIALEGGSYIVDPHHVMQIDMTAFENTVRETLRRGQEADVPPLPAAFLQALEAHRPLLPDLLYEEWLLAPRQRLADIYVDACLYTAEAFLLRGTHARAETWARRAIDKAPWLEEAYAVLIRALARQGRRSSALRVYETAAAALRQELEALPSPQLQWIGDRLRRGEEI